MQRRGFLASILAAGVAPAIIRDPMKIWVPKQEIRRASLGIIDSMSVRRGVGDLVGDSAYEQGRRPFTIRRTVQDEFGEAFFPTVVLTPLMVGLNGEALL